MCSLSNLNRQHRAVWVTNIAEIDACMTRLRITVNDPQLVAEYALWKPTGALGAVIKEQGVQVIYGPGVDVIKSRLVEKFSAQPA